MLVALAVLEPRLARWYVRLSATGQDSLRYRLAFDLVLPVGAVLTLEPSALTWLRRILPRRRVSRKGTKVGTRRLTQVALLAVLATGCSNAAETRTDDDALTTTRPTRAVGTNVEDLSRCVTPPQDVVAFIRKGLTDKRATLRFARAVKSTDPNFHYFVSAEIQAPGPFSGDDEIATWSVLEDLDDIAAFDLEAVNSVSGVAIEASTWPTSQELSMGIDGAWDSHVCVRAAL